MNLQLTQQKCLLANLNIRSEIHGEDHEPACDLKLECDLDSGILAEFHPALRSLLYHWNESREHDLADQGNQGEGYAPDLRMPKLAMPIKWEDETVGASCTIHHGIGGRSDIVLEGCRVNNWAITAREGGTISLQFRVQAKPDEKAIGKLACMVQTEIEVSVQPPSAEA